MSENRIRDSAPSLEADREVAAALQAAREGDSRGLHQLLERHRDRLLGRIRWMLGPRARRVAESGDFLHELCVAVLEGVETCDARTETAFLRWATAVARNRVRTSANAKRMQALESLGSLAIEALQESSMQPASAIAFRESGAILLEVLEQMPDDRRQVIDLRHFEGLSMAEIAEQMGRTENAAQLLHARALVELGRRLKQQLGPA